MSSAENFLEKYGSNYNAETGTISYQEVRSTPAGDVTVTVEFTPAFPIPELGNIISASTALGDVVANNPGAIQEIAAGDFSNAAGLAVNALGTIAALAGGPVGAGIGLVTSILGNFLGGGSGDALGSYLSQISNQLGVMDQKLDAISSQISSLSNQLEDAKNDILNNNNQQTAILTGAIQAESQAIQQRIVQQGQVISSQISELKEVMGVEFSEVKEKLDSVENSIAASEQRMTQQLHQTQEAIIQAQENREAQAEFISGIISNEVNKMQSESMQRIRTRFEEAQKAGQELEAKANVDAVQSVMNFIQQIAVADFSNTEYAIAQLVEDKLSGFYTLPDTKTSGTQNSLSLSSAGASVSSRSASVSLGEEVSKTAPTEIQPVSANSATKTVQLFTKKTVPFWLLGLSAAGALAKVGYDKLQKEKNAYRG